jgi:hypothetical protein
LSYAAEIAPVLLQILTKSAAVSEIESSRVMTRREEAKLLPHNYNRLHASGVPRKDNAAALTRNNSVSCNLELNEKVYLLMEHTEVFSF